jgi:hypothetical protein
MELYMLNLRILWYMLTWLLSLAGIFLITV